MTDGVRPVGPVEGRERRAAPRREVERRAATAGRALVPVDPIVVDAQDPASPAASNAPLEPGAAFAAQVMGQSGQRKGLKGGPPVLDAARSSYLGTEYSGDNDRRPSAGLIRKKEV